MASIFDLIKRNQVPAAVLRTAAKGAIPLPPGEMLEVLVYLTQNPVFAQDARMTLAGFDPVATVECVASPTAPAEVLGYFWAEQNRRPVLMPSLIENPAVTEELLMELAFTAPREIVNMLLASPRARSSPAVIEALSTNPRLTPSELRELKGEVIAEAPAADTEPDLESDALLSAWLEAHAAEMAAEQDKAFELIGTDEEESAAPAESGEEERAALPLDATDSQTLATADEKRLTLLQRIGHMKVADRVKTAFAGTRDERAILIRDGARVVQNAVLASPKISEPEIETFSAAKNVHENVLREIARNRRFMKNYSVQRNLVNNPKTPIEISLTLVRKLMVYDLKSLQRSRNVPETIRSIAQKLYQEKALSGGKLKD